MIDRILVKEWWVALHREWKLLGKLHQESNLPIEDFGWSNANHSLLLRRKLHYGNMESTLEWTRGTLEDVVDTPEFTAVEFLDLANQVHAFIARTWESYEKRVGERGQAIASINTVLRGQLSSWNLLGQNVKANL